jgi:hypothetical protein
VTEYDAILKRLIFSLLAQKHFRKSEEYVQKVSFNPQGKKAQEYFI